MLNKMVFHHIGIATENIVEMQKFINDQFDVACIGDIIYDKAQNADICMIELKSGINIELISGEKVKRIVQKCHYLYHTCYSVSNIDKKIEELIKSGYKIVQEPTDAILFNGKKVAFMSGNMGIIELLQECGNGNLTDQLIKNIGDENPMQQKYLNGIMSEYLLDNEKEDLEHIITFFIEKGDTLQGLVNAYLLFVEDTFKETKYFIDNGKYRYSAFDEVNDKVYLDDRYMKQYMKGLQISGYIWKNHLKIHRWFLDKIKSLSGDFYLEIGPGHGQYFADAVGIGNFKKYYAIDLSQSSIDLTQQYINSFMNNNDIEYELICGDFLQYDFSIKFDAICISEVLEHVEQPQQFLEKIYNVTNPNAKVYISVPVNAPAIDHIYLYRSVEDVINMVEAAGFIITDSLYATENDIQYEKAVKRNRAINCVLCVTK